MNAADRSAVHTAKPVFTEPEAAELVRRLFGVSGRLRPLPSERDQNYRIDGEDGGGPWILKISQSGEDPAILDLQNRALQRVAEREPSVGVSRVVPTQDGALMAEVPGIRDRRHLVRLLTWVEGEPMVDVRPHSPALLRDIGRLVGRVDRVLADFEHHAMRRDLKWDLRHAPAVIGGNLDDVVDRARRRLIERRLERYARTVAPRLDRARRSVIHGDANDYNVLVRLDLDGQHAHGLIDFGDMSYSWTVAGPAIAVAYAMLDKDDPLDAAARLVAGYHEAWPLTAEEIELVLELAVMRLCVSVTNAAHEARAHPGDEYLMVTEAPAWRLLERLDGEPVALGHAMLRRACGLPAARRAEAAVDWLGANGDALGPVLPISLASAPAVDLSPGSPALGLLRDGAACLAKAVERARAVAGGGAVLGAYAAPRLLDEDDALVTAAADRPERRSVHLGVDVFVDAGTEVLAPLDGAVHAIAADDGRLDGAATVVLRHRPADGVGFLTALGHVEPDRGLPAVGGPVARGTVVGRVAGPADNGGWPPHVHVQLATALEDADRVPAVAAPAHHDAWLGLCPDPSPLLPCPAAGAPADRLDADRIRARRAAHLGPSLSLAYRRPLTIVRGRGARLYDADGQAFLDCVNNVCHVGHCHPDVVRAGQSQMAVLNTNTRYLHEHLVRYAERLTATLPEGLDVCFFVCSGSEANELALRIALAHTGARDLIVLEAGYHGNTQGLVDVSSYKFDGPGGRGAPDHVHVVPLPDLYRGRYRADDPDAALRYAGHVRDAAAAARERGGLAGIIAESMPGCGGQIVLPAGYLAAAYAHVRDAGGVCIADEVQTGFGRPGTCFWSFQTQEVVPDIVTMGKPIGNGHPMGAVVTTRAIAESFDTGMEYFNTFGGNPVSCAIGLAVLDVIEHEGLQERARRVGARLLEGLRGLQERHSLVGDARGHGMYLGAELVLDRSTRAPAPAHAGYVVNRMRDKGFLLSTDGPQENVLKIKPPLAFGEADADALCAALDVVLGETALRTGRD